MKNLLKILAVSCVAANISNICADTKVYNPQNKYHHMTCDERCKNNGYTSASEDGTMHNSFCWCE